MIEVSHIVMQQGRGPMPIYTKDENTDKPGHRSLEAHMSRLSQNCCGAIVFDSEKLTDEDVDIIFEGNIQSLRVVNNCIVLNLYKVSILNEEIKKEDILNGKQLTFVAEMAHISSFQI